ncbi:MAG: TonB family protein [Xanthomonadaceae bacterium]|nr:TonB family protein [Xanthomonadaceae bacterium]
MSSDLAHDLMAFLTETTLAGSAAMILVLSMRATVRRWFGAGIAYALWILIPVAMLAVLVPAGVRPEAMQAMAVTVGALPEAIEGSVGASSLGLTSAGWLLVWLVGALAVGWRLTGQQRRFIASLGPVSADPQGLLRADASAGLPAVIGAFRQRIVVPCDFEQRFDAEQRALVLHHERIHVARGDTRINALVATLRCLHWFNPLVHLAAERFRQDQELSCDARVIADHPRARRRYGEAMLKTHLSAAALPLGCHWSGFGRSTLFPLKERIAMLNTPTPSVVRRTAGTFAIGSLCALIALSASALDVGSGSVAASEDVSYRRMAPPAYPAEALSNRQQGDVVLKVLVAADGTPRQIELESSSGIETIDQTAREAVGKWQFNPGMENGEPVEGWVLVPISFQLTEPAAPSPSPAGEGGIAVLDGIYIRPAAE